MNSINNPCGHTGFESNVCEICGYPDPSKMIASLKQQIASLKCCGNCTSYYIKWRDSPKSDYGLNQGAWVGNPGHGQDLLERIFKLEEENRHLKNLSIKDGLTGLYNRRFFNGQLKVEISRTRRTGESFCLIFIDLDNFKAVNDTLGHTKGDEFLIEISRRMKTKVRPTDFACRFGGDEFAVILPETTLSDAVKIAGRWHQNIGQAAAGMHLGVSASIGVDEFDVACRLDAQEFIHRVDQRLYQAKKEGRGKIVHPEIKKREDKAVTWDLKERV